jgi:hypothetical protein
MLDTQQILVNKTHDFKVCPLFSLILYEKKINVQTEKKEKI